MNGIHFTLFSLWVALACSYHLPKTKPPRVTRAHQLPDAVRAQGFKVDPELRIPNEKFCRDMQLQPYRHYMILPWWFAHCEQLLEKNEKLFREKKKQLPIYGRILNVVQQYKKKKALIDALQDSF